MQLFILAKQLVDFCIKIRAEIGRAGFFQIFGFQRFGVLVQLGDVFFVVLGSVMLIQRLR